MDTNLIHRLIKRSSEAPASVVELLQNTLIGTNGAQYQLLDTAEKIRRLHQPHFIYLERNQNCIGNVTICERDIRLNKEYFSSLYLRYFAFDQIFQGGKKQTKGQSNFHAYFNELFDTSNFNPENPEKEKSMYWAFIDPQNLKSFNMNERFGFQTIGQFKTTAYSRVQPKKSPNVERIQEADKNKVEALIADFYKDFNFYSPVHLFDQNNYFVFKKEGKIVAGIQANPVHWKIKDLPGISGKMLIKAAPYLPRIRKLIKPQDHKFLATEGLFWKEGYENCIDEFLSAVLAETEHFSLLIWTDVENTMLNRLDLKWGFIQQMKKDNLIHIVAKFNNFDTSEIQEIKKQKKYLSGFDMT